MSNLIIYLTNLTHVSSNNVAAIESIPLNIGYLASYVKKIFNENVEIELFNMHEELIEAVNRKRPHILAGSNYSWNSNISYFFIEHFKKAFPDIISVMGGPTFPYSDTRKRDFFNERRSLDFYISGEGELPFIELIRACLELGADIDKVKDRKPAGCCFVKDSSMVEGVFTKRPNDLDSIPSPYLGGILDKFLDRGFTPIIQSNRGCPFTCAYCCSSTGYYNRVNFFSVGRVTEEIEYIAKRVKSPSIHVHDDNFGMFPRDYEICKKFSEMQKRYKWPVFISAATGKNSKENIIKCVELLGHSINFSVSVQSSSAKVLKNIHRDNICLDDMWGLQQKLVELGVCSHSEFILPLPGETRESHLEGLKSVMSAGVDSIGPYTTMMLPASPLDEEKEYEKFRMVKKFRLVPRDFGKYVGENITEVEKVCVATKDLSFDDYLFLRGFHLILYCYYNGETFKELINYLKSIGVGAYDFCYALLTEVDRAPESVKKMFNGFILDTRKELWDSEEDLHKYYKEDANFDKLQNHLEGYNLLQKYHGLLFVDCFRPCLEYALNVSIRLLRDKQIDYDEVLLNNIASYILNSRGKIFEMSSEDVTADFKFDVHAWRQGKFKKPIMEYKKEIRLRFLQTDEQRNIIRNYLKIYGDVRDGKGRALTRINPKVLFRDVLVVDQALPERMSLKR